MEHCLIKKHKFVGDLQTSDMGLSFHVEHFFTNIKGSSTSILNYDNNDLK